jgi:hypothetical protein
MKFEVFERLNTGGISLNAQELRNSLYRGSLNAEIKDLVTIPSFRKCIGTRSPRKRMVDEELVLRFLALRDRLHRYRPPLKRVLNEYMNENRNASATWLKQHHDVFESTMLHIAEILGSQAFRLIDAKGRPLRDAAGRPLPRGVNRALFDAQALAFSWLSKPIPPGQRSAVVASISRALADEQTQDATRRATGDRKRIFLRLNAMVDALKACGVTLDVPFDLRAEDV